MLFVVVTTTATVPSAFVPFAVLDSGRDNNCSQHAIIMDVLINPLTYNSPMNFINPIIFLVLLAGLLIPCVVADVVTVVAKASNCS